MHFVTVYDLVISWPNLNSKIVDCSWDAWVDWTDCTKTATGTCGVQGGGNSQRIRAHLIEAANVGGIPCEAASIEDNNPCCADKDTDSTNCATEECLPGKVLKASPIKYRYIV